MPPTRGQAAPRGTGFIDFGRYLEVNRPQASDMANRIADPIAQRGQEVDQDLGAAESNFNQEWLRNMPSQRPMSELTDAELQQALGGYQGPTELNGVEDMAGRAAGVQRDANLIGSGMGGVGALIQDSIPKSSTYSVGMNMLDAGLAGAASGGRFEQLKSQYGGLFGKVADKAQEYKTRGSSAKDFVSRMVPGAQAELTKRANRPDPFDEPKGPQYKQDQFDNKKYGKKYDFLD